MLMLPAPFWQQLSVRQQPVSVPYLLEVHLISTSIGQTFGEDMAAGLFSKQMGIAIIEMFVLAIVALTGIFNLIV